MVRKSTRSAGRTHCNARGAFHVASARLGINDSQARIFFRPVYRMRRLLRRFSTPSEYLRACYLVPPAADRRIKKREIRRSAAGWCASYACRNRPPWCRSGCAEGAFFELNDIVYNSAKWRDRSMPRRRSTFPATTRWTNLPLKPEFVPLILRMVGYLEHRPAGAASSDSEAGETEMSAQGQQQRFDRLCSARGIRHEL
jgi:hypothetical protein